jgi:hypothetical protein
MEMLEEADFEILRGPSVIYSENNLRYETKA